MDEPGSDTALRRLVWLASCALLICMAFVALPGVAAAKKAAKPIGAVYSETNGVPANQLLVFNRYGDGHLKLAQKVSTGGKGGQQDEPGCPGQCPLLDAQGEVRVTNDGKWVFAVNAGSNTIASFRVGATHVSRVQVVPSGRRVPEQHHHPREPALRAEYQQQEHRWVQDLQPGQAESDCRLKTVADRRGGAALAADRL